MIPLFLHVCRKFPVNKLHQFLTVVPKVQMHSVYSSDFCLFSLNAPNRDIRSSFTKDLVIPKLKTSRFYRLLAMIPWAKLKSRSGTFASNIAAPQGRVSQVIHMPKRGADWENSVNSHGDYHVAIPENKVRISTWLVHSILTGALCMQRVVAQFFPKMLTEQQKQLHAKIAQDMLDWAKPWPILHEDQHYWWWRDMSL